MGGGGHEDVFTPGRPRDHGRVSSTVVPSLCQGWRMGTQSARPPSVVGLEFFGSPDLHRGRGVVVGTGGSLPRTECGPRLIRRPGRPFGKGLGSSQEAV